MYKAIGIDSVGKYNLSTLPNSRASVWSPSKSKRFKAELSSVNDNPPPGTYNPSDMDSQNGNYILSNFKTLGTKRMVPIQRNEMNSQT